MAEQIKLSDAHVQAMRAEFDRNRTARGQDKIPVLRIEKVIRAGGQELTMSEIRKIEKEGNDGSGMIDFNRLITLVALAVQASKGISFYRTVFNMIDTDGQGHITFEQLKTVIYKLQELTPEMQLTEEDVNELVNSVRQSTKSNKVTFEDFYGLVAD